MLRSPKQERGDTRQKPAPRIILEDNGRAGRRLGLSLESVSQRLPLEEQPPAEEKKSLRVRQ